MEILNSPAFREAEGDIASVDGLQGMKQTFASIASDRSMFGTLENSEVAAAQVEKTALSMLNEMEKTGVTVEDIRASAVNAAAVGEEADADSHSRLSAFEIGALNSLVDAMDGKHQNENLPPPVQPGEIDDDPYGLQEAAGSS